MAGKYDEAKIAEDFNLTDAEAAWVTRAVDRGGDPEQAALAVRAQRVGPAALPEYRPLPDATAEKFAAAVEPELDADDEHVEVLD